MKIGMLFLSSVPKDADQVKLLEEERRAVESAFQVSRHRNWLGEISFRTVLEFDDFEQYLEREMPQILHFSGHASDGQLKIGSRFIPIDFLGRVFANARGHLSCVTLGSCYSEAQAQEIARSIPYAIGTKNLISQKNSIRFSRYFYQYIGDGKDVESAFSRTKDLMQAEFRAGDALVLLSKESQEPLILVPPSLAIDLTDLLNNARHKGEEGDRSGGSLAQVDFYSEYYTYELELQQIEVRYSSSFESERYIQNYIINGKWSSQVRLERWASILNRKMLVDAPWGANKKPYGNFSAKVQTIDGALGDALNISVMHREDGPNKYASEKVEAFIESRIREVML